jgi:hypothetical protein
VAAPNSGDVYMSGNLYFSYSPIDLDRSYLAEQEEVHAHHRCDLADILDLESVSTGSARITSSLAAPA